MHHIFRANLLCLLMNLLGIPLSAQTDTIVGSGELFFNQGAINNAANQYFRSTASFGQPMIGTYFSAENQGGLGFWSRLQLAPLPPMATASEGDYPDRVLVEWGIDPLSPSAKEGFNLYRDGAFLAHLDGSTQQYIDFNVVPGNFYDYEVRGVNKYGEGKARGAVG
ncbi:MAG: hypothetical protein AAFO94_22045, partial [Bacteroidota bacterium]